MNPPGNNLSAVLLAGGQSRRMGRDKALLEIGGQPLWSVQIAKLEKVASQVLVSVRNLSQPVGDSYAKIMDPPGSCGPLGGLVSALEAAEYSHLLVLAVDLPRMSAEYLSRLYGLCAPSRGVAPILDGFYLGTSAVYPREILPLAKAILAGDDHSFQILIRQGVAAGLMTPLEVTEEERPLFANWNTPEAIEQ